ncbi:MAG: hypothetical protein IPI17_12490 [Nitrosomonas sp.]|jgi:hypothetical protein|nr:hypothetical protein [Nitrosomonas sp.]
MAIENSVESISSRNIASLLARHAVLEIPEQGVMLAVVLKAISDLMDKTPSNRYFRSTASDFFARGTHVFFCDMCGLNPDWVVEILRDHAGLDCAAGGR